MIRFQNTQSLLRSGLPYNTVFAGEEPFPGGRVLTFVSRPGAGSYLRTAVALPDEWNGVFVGTGNGGMAGALRTEELKALAAAGYVCANSDLGTSRGTDSGINNPDLWADFGWRGTHIMTVSGKLAAEKCYGTAPAYSYFRGKSTGGQQGFAEALRFPRDYDGIAVSAPCISRTGTHMVFLWNWICLHRDGKHILGKEKIAALSRAAAEYHLIRGGARPGDGFVSRPVHSAEGLGAFAAFAAERLSLSDDDRARLLRVWEGPRDPRDGRNIAAGMTVGAESGSGGMGMDPHSPAAAFFFYPFRWAFGPDYTGEDFDFGADAERMEQILGPDLNADDPDLTAFSDAGGKLIVTCGSSDPLIPCGGVIAHARRVAAALGKERADSTLRCFMLPGMDHYDTGPGTHLIRSFPEGGDLLTALRCWREKGTAPRELYGWAPRPDGEFLRRARAEKLN